MSRAVWPLSRAAVDFAERPAMLGADGTITYREYADLVDRAATWLVEAGVKPGQRVMLYGRNSVEIVLALWGVLRLGAVACPVSFRFPGRMLHELAGGIGASHTVFTSQVPRVSFPHIASHYWPEGPLPRRGLSFPYEYSIGDTVTILLTSGSSGLPKGVAHSLHSHLRSAEGANHNMRLRPGDRWLLSLPLFHAGGLAILFRAMLAGAAVVKPTAQDLAADIGSFAVTHLSMVPTQLYRLLQRPEAFTSLKAVLVGGGPVPEELIARAHAADLPLVTSYGLTETASHVTATAPDDPPGRLATSGRVLPYRELSIAADREILVRGETLFRGYVKGDKFDRPLTRDGWFRTGDVGCLDRNGYLTVMGRKDNMFVTGGENVHPEQIEAVLCRAPGVVQAVVVPVPDAEYGARPVAFIECAEGTLPEEGSFENELAARVPRFMWPLRYFPLDVSVVSGIKPPRHLLSQRAAALLSRR